MICDKCFVDTEKEPHADWCPNKPKDIDFDEMFPGIKNK